MRIESRIRRHSLGDKIVHGTRTRNKNKLRKIYNGRERENDESKRDSSFFPLISDSLFYYLIVLSMVCVYVHSFNFSLYIRFVSYTTLPFSNICKASLACAYIQIYKFSHFNGIFAYFLIQLYDLSSSILWVLVCACVFALNERVSVNKQYSNILT